MGNLPPATQVPIISPDVMADHSVQVSLGLGFSVVGFLVILSFTTFVLRQPAGRDDETELKQIAGYIHEGAKTFLFQEYKWLAPFVLIMCLIFGVLFGVLEVLAMGPTSPAVVDGNTPFKLDRGSGGYLVVSILLGAMFSAGAGYLGMYIATMANIRTTHACREGLGHGLSVAFKSGAVMGLTVVCLSLFGLSLLYMVFTGIGILHPWTYIAGFGFGASAIALFARVGGGVYTKAADVGADLVGKVENNIPEDDCRNPAVIADNVGDNVGDVAGMGADLFESYSGSIIAACSLAAVYVPEKSSASAQCASSLNPDDFCIYGLPALGKKLGTVLNNNMYYFEYCPFEYNEQPPSLVPESGIKMLCLGYGNNGQFVKHLFALPFWIAGAGIIASIIGVFAVRTSNEEEEDTSHLSKEEKAKHDIEQLEVLLNKTRLGISVAGVLSLGLSLILMYVLFDQTDGLFVWRFWGCMVTGLLAGIFIGLFTEYVTSYSYSPTKSIAEMSGTGPATVIIQGLGVGMISCTIPTMILVVAILAANALASVYGISIAAVGMLSTLGVTLATDAYGPVADNAGGIAEMVDTVEDHVRERTDALDALGNTTAATGKGFAIGSAVLTAVGLITAFMEESGLTCSSAECISVDLKSPAVLCGVLIGAMLPYLFAALTMLSVGSSAESIILQVRDQFYEAEQQFKREDAGWWDKFHPEQWAERVGKPAYEWYRPCIAIATTSALREMIVPGVISIFAPVAIGFLLGSAALAGLLGGALTSGFMLAVMMANSGGAWDNAKKYTELGLLGPGRGKGSDSHDAAVTGDTVGDPFKDTSGPSLNILIKLMSILSLVLAPVYFLIYRKETRPFLGNETPGDDFTGAWVGPVIGVIIIIVVGIGSVLFTISNKKSKEKLTAEIEAKAEARNKGNDYEDVVLEREVRSFGEESRADPPFVVVTEITMKSVEGGLAYAKAFNEMAETRNPYASTFLLVQSKTNPLIFTSTSIFRSSNAFIRHFQDEESAANLKKMMLEHVDFSATTSCKVLGSVSASVRRVLGDMGAINQVIAGGYTWRGGVEGEDPILIVNNFKVKGEAEGKVYAETFEEVASRMSPFAATYLLTKDPSDDVTFTEYFIFRSTQHFSDHYQTAVVQSNLTTSMSECVTEDSSSMSVLAIGSKRKAETARAVFDQINASYHQVSGGYVFSNRSQ